MSFLPIAIVGRSCVLPGAHGPDALWDAVVEGRDLIGTAPPGRWRLGEHLAMSSGPADDRTWSDRGGYVTGFSLDPDGLDPDVLALDPLFQWTLHGVREALREAGHHGRSSRAGLVMGNLSFPSSSMARYAESVWLDAQGPGLLGGLAADLAGVERPDPRNRFTSGLPAHLAARALGLDGVAFALDAACASSLYAIALACQHLQDRTADLMVAGAVNRADDLFIHVGFCALSAMSRTGRSRPFHRDADGLVPAEGAAFVALKRLDDARVAGDRVFGVIRGVGLGNDGRGKGLLAPSAAGQVRAMRAAYRSAGLSPADVSLVECHATGTQVGDATEIESTAEVFAGCSDVPLGSLKSNLGHLVTVAGAAALLKVLGAMQAGVRPPTLHAAEPLDALDGSPFRLLQAAERWDGPRRAGISAFGFGGNNAHLVVEEALERPPATAVASPAPRDPVAIVALSARLGDGDLSTPGARATHITLPLEGLRFPPRDLDHALPQQLMLLRTAMDAVGDRALSSERTGVWVGMGCDPEIARYGARWRLAEWAGAWGAAVGTTPTADWVAAAQDAFQPSLVAAGVVGTMPNIPANRLNRQFDIAGPGFTVSAEELSGVRALEIAVRALRAEDVDTAVVGAVDLSDEPVHRDAAGALLPAREHGDAAVVLVLQRLADVSGPVIAVIDEGQAEPFEADLPVAHAASGLVQVAAAAMACHRGDRDAARVEISALGGQRAVVTLRAGDRAALPEVAEVHGVRFDAHAPAVTIPPLEPPDARPEPVHAERGAMPPAPELPPVTQVEEEPAPQPAPAPPPAAVAGLQAAPAAQPVLAQMAALQAQLGAVHQEYLARQQALHEQFLKTRQQATEHLLQAYGRRQQPPPPVPDPAPAAVPLAAPVPTPPRLPGPKYDRAQLELLASGKISQVLGPMFAVQDDFPRQVRMPEPPLLLADRVTGIDAEPGSGGTGTLWTETDVTADAWYLQNGRMPAGIMIEAGQADLLLISWLGADFENRGERVYRLLGCELTYHACSGPGSVLPAPGDTLVYDIHIDGHARQGPVRLFFFHYDCLIDGAPRLTVRGGQAGFFTDEELAGSGGVLWTPADSELDPDAVVDGPTVACTRDRFDAGQVRAWAEGRPWDCFGPGFEQTRAHVWTPQSQAGDVWLLDEATAFEAAGGPWGRGYLRAETTIAPDDWYFPGHFKGDPCMPGTLMFEGCLQAMGLYMGGMGFTVARDGWRFEPVPDEPYLMRCRGQVIPSSKHLVYEVFVREVRAGPVPTVYADLLCTVDGLKAFYARRVGLRLVPDWPLSRPEGSRYLQALPPAPSAEVDGFSFDHASLIACAWGRPTHAFGPMYAPFDSHRQVARLPGPPYHFMSRVARIDAAMGAMQPGGSVEVHYDVPPQAWYFRENGAQTMPFAVLMEAALQPCGWLASFVGCALSADGDMLFRNLDGTGTLTAEIVPDSGTLRTEVTLRSLSRSGGMILVSFEVACRVGDAPVYAMDTTFGFFPPEAFVDQPGLGASDAQRAVLTRHSRVSVDLAAAPDRFCGGSLRLARPMLRMLDRVTGLWTDGGTHDLGGARAVKDVDPDEWFFKAHFFGDPVQPGSLGVEALVQLVQVWMLHAGLDDGIADPHFEPVALGEACTWKYRGQVVPTNREIATTIDIVEVRRDDDGVLAVADGHLWVDGKRIYQLTRLGVRIASGGVSTADLGGSVRPGRHVELRPDPPWRASPVPEVLDPAVDTWLADHCPTWTVPALPMMSMVDLLATAAGVPAHGLRDVAVHRWLPLPGPVRIRTDKREVADGVEVTLLAWREAANEALSRFEPVASGVVLTDPQPRPEPLASLQAPPAPDPYASGALFHGPAFQLLRSLAVGASGATAMLDARAGGVPAGTLHQGLLDAATHAIPHDDLSAWWREAPEGHVAYPYQIPRAAFFGPAPLAEVRCEARFEGTDADGRPRFHLQLIAGEAVWADLELVEVLMPKGPIGRAAPTDRVAFLRDRRFVPGLGLSTHDGDTTRLATADVRASDWLPGTVAAAYAARGDLTEQVAVKDHVARLASVHPASVTLSGGYATTAAHPITRYPVTVEPGVTVRDAGAPEQHLAQIRGWWRNWFGLERWPVEDLYYGLIERYVGKVVVEDFEAFDAVRGRSVLYLANHQVMVESLLFSVLVSALAGVTTVTLAKAEHRTSWLGRLIAHAWTWPGARDPEVIAFFDRSDKRSLPRIIGELGAEMAGPGKSVMVHVEGTRSLECRTPVQRMSSAFVDLALKTGSPIVPVRLVGGLPVEPLPARIEFPHHHARQDYWLGRPILPEALEAVPYRDRKAMVIEAMNGLGPAEESPQPGDAAFEALADERAARTGAEPAHAALMEMLRASGDLHPALQPIVDAEHTLEPGKGAEGRWVAELARRLYGPRGPKVG